MITISNISKVINAGVSFDENGFIPTQGISEWLENKGLLEKKEIPNGSYRRMATEQAADFGITNLYNSNHNFKSVMFNRQAQQWIYDSIDEISEFCTQNEQKFSRIKIYP